MSLTGAELRLLPYLATHLSSRRSRAGCSSRATPSRPRRSRSTASSASHRVARRSSAPSRSGCWRARSIRRRRISPAEDDAHGRPRRLDMHGGNGRVQAASAAARRARRGAPRSDRGTAAHSATTAIDERTAALVRVAATIAVDAAPSSFQHAVALALAAGATNDEIVASLEAVTPVTGAARVVQCPRRSRSRSATTSTPRSSGSTRDERRISHHRYEESRSSAAHGSWKPTRSPWPSRPGEVNVVV